MQYPKHWHSKYILQPLTKRDSIHIKSYFSHSGNTKVSFLDSTFNILFRWGIGSLCFEPLSGCWGRCSQTMSCCLVIPREHFTSLQAYLNILHISLNGTDKIHVIYCWDKGMDHHVYKSPHQDVGGDIHKPCLDIRFLRQNTSLHWKHT